MPSQARTTDDAGKYSFTDLTLSAFTLQAVAPIPIDEGGYGTQGQAVTLTADQSVNFFLTSH